MLNEFIQGLLDFQFLQNALITSVMVGISAGIIGSFIILRGMSLMGDAISHAVLPGVALSYMLGSSYIIGPRFWDGVGRSHWFCHETQSFEKRYGDRNRLQRLFCSRDHLDFLCQKFHGFVSHPLRECAGSSGFGYVFDSRSACQRLDSSAAIL